MATTGSSPQSTVFASRDADEVTEFIGQMYVGNRCTFASPRDRRARFETRVHTAAGISSSHLRSSIDYRVETDPFETFVFIAVRGGRVRVRHGKLDVDVTRGQAALHPLGAEITLEIDDVDAHLVELPPTRLDQVASEIAGVGVGELAFHAITPATPALGAYWWSVMGLLGGALSAAGSPMRSPLLAEEMIRTVAVAALHVFPNSAMTLPHAPSPGHVGSAALRRAVAFIEANAHRPVTLSEIAAAAGTGPRALQYAFRRHHGVTPLSYARRVRLERAHRNLQAADPTRGDTVAAIAARWGFAKPDRFSASYREAFGTLPSHTLRH